MLGLLMRPFFLGIAVNDLIKGSYEGLIHLFIVHALWLIIGVIRHMYDTRTYSAIYNSVVIQFLARRYGQDETSKLAAHSTLTKDFVDFLEFDLVYIIEAIYNIFGSMILLFFYDARIVWLCFIILIPVMIISYFYGKKMKKLTRLKNDELENQVNIISSGDRQQVKNHYDILRGLQIKISDKEAWNFGLLEVIVMIVVGVSLVVSTNVFGTVIMAGSIIGIYNYILKFMQGMDTIPYIMQRYSVLSDIIRRIELNAEDFDI
jgi:ABC-type multidrug transport system fused ATPase/permease subunit